MEKIEKITVMGVEVELRRDVIFRLQRKALEIDETFPHYVNRKIRCKWSMYVKKESVPIQDLIETELIWDAGIVYQG